LSSPKAVRHLHRLANKHCRRAPRLELPIKELTRQPQLLHVTLLEIRSHARLLKAHVIPLDRLLPVEAGVRPGVRLSDALLDLQAVFACLVIASTFARPLRSRPSRSHYLSPHHPLRARGTASWGSIAPGDSSGGLVKSFLSLALAAWPSAADFWL